MKGFFEVLSEEYPAPVCNDCSVPMLARTEAIRAEEGTHKEVRCGFQCPSAARSSLSGLRKTGYLEEGGRTLSRSQGSLVLCTTRAPRHAGSPEGRSLKTLIEEPPQGAALFVGRNS